MSYDRATTLELWRPGPMVRWQRYYMVVWRPPLFGGGAGAGQGDEESDEESEGESEGGQGFGDVQVETTWAEVDSKGDQPNRLGWNTHGAGPPLDPRMGERSDDPRWSRLAEEVSAALTGQATLRESVNSEAPEIQPRAAELVTDPAWGSIVDMVRGQPSLVRSVAPGIVDQLLEGSDARGLDDAAEALSQLRADLSMIAPGLEDANPEEIGGNDDRVALADKLMGDPKIRKVLELAGRIASQAFASRTSRTPAGRDEVKDVERGSDITRTLASQLAYLADPDLEALFLKDLVEGALLQYQFEGKERVRRGPIVLCLDQSGSMAISMEDWKRRKSLDYTPPADKLTPNDLASAIAIGMLRMAHAQKRDVYLCGFDEDILWTRVAKKTASPIFVAEIVQFLVKRGTDGGTSFDPPLSWAIGLVEQHRINADIVFLTDGEGALKDTTAMRLRRAKAKQGLGLFLLLIDQQPKQPLAGLADAIVQVKGEDGCLDFGEKFVTTERAPGGLDAARG